eukprot:TRINITY_DN671_c0_g2_i1.p1 TRINITY_DN671_c0_g2~~TRINITY_DN671_c0_g2_i1.p1  ORF type:complete len:240 (-),score=-27.54 TRINITY_DN671_c0_g2_i1:329-1048(-)
MWKRRKPQKYLALKGPVRHLHRKSNTGSLKCQEKCGRASLLTLRCVEDSRCEIFVSLATTRLSLAAVPGGQRRRRLACHCSPAGGGSYAAKVPTRNTKVVLATLANVKCISLQGATRLSTWLPLPKRIGSQEAWNATFDVRKIVSGKGVLNRWLKAVFEAPEEDFVPGVKARNVCVRPETAAGAVGAFAAFLGDKIVIVTVACAWSAVEVGLRDEEKEGEEEAEEDEEKEELTLVVVSQ